MSKTVLLQTIQFSISTQLSSIWPIYRALSDATTPGNEEVLCLVWFGYLMPKPFVGYLMPKPFS